MVVMVFWERSCVEEDSPKLLKQPSDSKYHKENIDAQGDFQNGCITESDKCFKDQPPATRDEQTNTTIKRFVL